MIAWLWLCRIFTGFVTSDVVVHQVYCYLAVPEHYISFRTRFGSSVERLYREKGWWKDEGGY